MNLVQIGLTGLRAAQTGLNLAARNTANLQTEGYSRQDVALLSDPRGGVRIASSIRHADDHRGQQLWAAQSREGRHSVAEPFYGELEALMGLGEGSAGGRLDAFFAALDQVSVDPTSVALRQQVIAAASHLATRMNALRDTLQGQWLAVARQSEALAAQAGALSATVADLNARIGEAALSGHGAAELMDQRDLAIGKLAALVEIRVSRQADDTYAVSLKDGVPLVVGARSARFDARTGVAGDVALNVQFGRARYPLAGDTAGGQIGGLQAYAREASSQQQRATTLARELGDRVNAVLTAGYGTDGRPGKALFAFDAASGTLSVDSALDAAALGLSAAANEPGNSDQLARLRDVRSQAIALPGLGPVPLGQAYGSMMGRLATDSAANRSELGIATALHQQARLSLDAVRGVSSEEEAVHIAELMQAYQANMKVISVAGRLFEDTLAAL